MNPQPPSSGSNNQGFYSPPPNQRPQQQPYHNNVSSPYRQSTSQNVNYRQAQPQPSPYYGQRGGYSTQPPQNRGGYPAPPNSAQNLGGYSDLSKYQNSVYSSSPNYSNGSYSTDSTVSATDNDIRMIKYKSLLEEVIKKIDSALNEQGSVVAVSDRLNLRKKGLIRLEDDMRTEAENVRSSTRLCEKTTENLLNKATESNTKPPESEVMIKSSLDCQILELTIERNSLEDLIYYLSVGLNRNVIELEEFIKEVRIYSRKLFLTKALLQKCMKTIGVEEGF